MGYPRDLDEYSTEELLAEIARREKAWSEGLCDYCGRSRDTCMCRFQYRHVPTKSDKPKSRVKGGIVLKDKE